MIKFTTMIFIFLFASISFGAESWSERLASFEVDEKARDELIHHENNLTKNIFDNSPLKSKMLSFFRDQKVATLKTFTLKTNVVLSLVDGGYGKSIDLVANNNGVLTKIFASNDMVDHRLLSVLTFDVSPDQNFAIVVATRAGSIDRYQLFIVDLANYHLVSSSFVHKSTALTWVDAHTVFLKSSEGQLVKLATEESKIEVTSVGKDVYEGNPSAYLRCSGEEVLLYIQGVRQGPISDVSCYDWKKIIKISADEIIYISNGTMPTLTKIDYSTLRPVEGYVFDDVVEDSIIIGHNIFIWSNWGEIQTLSIFDQNRELKFQKVMPKVASLVSIGATNDSQKVKLFFQSFVRNDLTAILNLSTEDIENLPSDNEFLTTLAGEKYISEVLMLPARDGVLIPTRVTYKTLDQKIPLDLNAKKIFIEVYGGFNIRGRLSPRYSSVYKKLLLDKGGVYVAPAIRGGNEYGDDWYSQAKGPDKKIISINDLADVTKNLISKFQVRPQDIAVTGTSNGGFTVLAAGILYPQLFGLVIPVSGVYDLLGINHLDKLFAKGWWEDYGNPDDEDQAILMRNYSPLELTLTSLPHILFLNGLKDSRVSPLHSQKMLQRIRLEGAVNSTSVHAFFVNNDGHWPLTNSYGDLIASYENSLMWTFIYQQFSFL